MYLYSTVLVCFLSLLTFTAAPSDSPTQQQPTPTRDEFRWLDSNRDSGEWSRISLAFSSELKPDVPNNINGGPVAYRYKYISRIGIFQTAALVIIGHRETKIARSGDYFSAFNYDIRSGSKSAIEDADDLWEWKLVKLARFESSVTPDVAFRYVSCVECEEQTYIAAFRYDPSDNRWDLRKWGFDKRISVSETPSPDDLVASFGCLHKLSDSNADGFDDLAVWCEEVSHDQKGKIQTDSSTTLYSFKDGHFTKTYLYGPEKIKVQEELCQTSHASTLCKHHSSELKAPE
jgi:hypothetical protein